MSTVITGHIDHAGQVLGVHGGEGAMGWLRAATGSHLFSDWDGVEWVSFEPGGRAGMHTHSHTEEIWFFLRGTGEIELDGKRHLVQPGSIVLTPLHSRHAAWNTGDEPLQYVVIEVFPPEIRDVLPLRRPTDETVDGTISTTERPIANVPTVPGGYVGLLSPGEHLEAEAYFAGAWTTFDRRRVTSGDVHTVRAETEEYAIFVMRGSGTFVAAGTPGTFTQGSVFTVGWEATLELRPDEETELFVTALAVHV